MSLMDDPAVAANLTQLGADTGIPVEVLAAAINEPAPEGIDPARWYSASLTVGRTARPFPRHVVEEIHRMAAPHMGDQQSPAA